MGSILESDPVVVGGPTASKSADVHRDTSKPPLLTNTVATLAVAEDRDSNLANNRNSDSTHSWKLTGQGAGFPGGFATRVQFGSEYKNDKGESVAPIVTMDTTNLFGSAYLGNVTSTGYDLYCPPVVAGATVHIRVSTKNPT